MPHLIKLNKISNNKNLIATNHLCPIKKEKCYNSLRYVRKVKALQ